MPATGSPPPEPVQTEIGPYRLATRIAVGGMAEVFRALRRQTAGADRAVVIKRMLPSLAADPEGRAMFEREASLGLAIRHPNVVEHLEHAVDGDAPYLVLEYVFGVDLRRLLRFLARGGRPMPVPLAAWVAKELLAGLAAVHGAVDRTGGALRIVHRDVSPSNVFLSVHGDVKLGDLGIARALREAGHALGPRAQAAKGKLGYLAPEQVEGAPGDARSDVFSAAVVIAEMLLGRPLFVGGSDLGVLLAIRDARLDALDAASGTLPAGLVAALRAALARSPEERTASAAELAVALAPFAEGPEAQLRSQLGALTVGALDAAPDEVDHKSLARTVEGDARTFAAGRLLGEDRARLFDLDSPGMIAAPGYEVHRRGAVLGPWSYARIVQALRTGEIERDSEVAIGQAPPRPLDEIPELARHLLPSARVTPKPRPLLETSESWDLSRGGLAPILADLLVGRETGLLLAERDGTRKEIYLERGVPTFVTSNQIGELLGERLVRAGIVERGELELALAVMPRFEGRLGDTLVSLGLVDPLVMFRHITEQVRDKLLEVFEWTSGRAALYRGAPAPVGSFPLHLDPWDLLESGVARRLTLGLDPRAAERALFGRDPAWNDPLPLPARLAGALELLGTPRSLPELASTDRERARVLLLVDLGAARLVR